jgi:hypothetical protein
MAIRPMIRFSIILLMFLFAVPALACFGPKLYLGVGTDATGQVLASFVAIYVKETTGTDVERVQLERRDPVAEIIAEKIDFSFAESGSEQTVILMAIDRLPPLLAGPRIDNDLQFTTVRPTLIRLAGKLTAADVAALSAKVETGALAMDVVRHFLIERRWI